MTGPGQQGTATHCPYCALQCGMWLRTDDTGRTTVAPRDFPTNQGGLCRKGWTAAELLRPERRLTTPLVRRTPGGPLEEADWDEALERVVSGVRRIQDRAGRDAVAVFGGGGLTNEKAYLLGKFARVTLRTASIDYNGRFCMSSAAAAGLRAFGLDRGLPFPLADVGRADTPEEVFEELRRAAAGGPADYSGITYDRIDAEGGVFWPSPATDGTALRAGAEGEDRAGTEADTSRDSRTGADTSPGSQPHSDTSRDSGPRSSTPQRSAPGAGTPRMFLDAFAHPDGRARFVAVHHTPPAEEPDERYPLNLTTGRIMQHYQSGAQTRRVPELAAAAGGPQVEIHPDLAARHGIAAGDRVRVVSRRGATEADARITTAVPPDTLFMPFHWGGAQRVNSVVGDALDPVSRMPEFKVSAVRLERVG
ncbi:hypothetical protein TN53_12540 [Streptomyces sp. WM6386]|nr:hypothetical protein TN53_12540 [Streptomyces sp. WM6386]KKD15146.1 hypothetical protein TR66_11605 [Streptomyces sp. WM6391]